MSETGRSIAEMILEIPSLIRQTITAELRRANISQPLPCLQVLGRLAKRPGNVSELARLQGVTAASMSATVADLVDQGLVRRRQFPADRRQVILELSPQGCTVQQAAEKVINDLLATQSDEDQNAMTAGLDVLTDIFHRANKPRW